MQEMQALYMQFVQRLTEDAFNFYLNLLIFFFCQWRITDVWLKTLKKITSRKQRIEYSEQDLTNIFKSDK